MQGQRPYSALKQLQKMNHLPSASHMGVKSEGGNETGGKGAGHNLEKNEIAVGHDKNWLGPTRSKMAEDLTSSEP